MDVIFGHGTSSLTGGAEMQEDLSTNRSRLLSVSVRLGLALALGVLALLLLIGLGPVASSPLAEANTQPSINLDTTFGTGGVVMTSIGSSDSWASSVAIQDNGRIVAAGSAYNQESFAIACYTVTGELDTSFGTGGVVTTVIGPSYNYANDVAIQQDGKIVAAGFARKGSRYDFALVRYTVTGTLDTAFGTGGVVTTSIGSGSAQARGVTIQDDDKIVAVGRAWNGSNDDFAVVRYTITGTLDTSFGTGGVAMTSIGSSNDWAWSVAVQEDDKLVVAGASDSAFAVVRYTVTGTLDTAFGTGGVVTTSIGPDYAVARSVAIQQDDGKIVAAGNVYSDDTENFALVRYTVTGTLDTAFGTGGVVITPIGTKDDGANDVAIQDDGKIVAAGADDSLGDDAFAVARYTASGALDTSFHPGGVAITPIGTQAAAYGVAIQEKDGKIVAVGDAFADGGWNFALVRYWARLYYNYLPLVLRNS
jgi:uncharacterized delta-60 repeat protein